MAPGRSKRVAPVFLPAVVLLLHLTLSTANAADSLAFGQYLSGNQTLVSKLGIFELGFFRPGSSTKQYLGMWHNNVVQRVYVWVANRDKPISESVADSAVVKISDDGAAFAIFANTSSTTPIWSSSTSIPSGNRTTGRNSTRLLLLDTGNLVLVDGNSLDPSAFLWESFDHLTDTC